MNNTARRRKTVACLITIKIFKVKMDRNNGRNSPIIINGHLYNTLLIMIKTTRKINKERTTQ